MNEDVEEMHPLDRWRAVIVLLAKPVIHPQSEVHYGAFTLEERIFPRKVRKTPDVTVVFDAVQVIKLEWVMQSVYVYRYGYDYNNKATDNVD